MPPGLHSCGPDWLRFTHRAVQQWLRSQGDGRSIPDEKLSALSTSASLMLETRGRPGQRDVDSFLAAGYTERHILESILAISVKTLSNNTNHLFHTPVDSVFARRAWAA